MKSFFVLSALVSVAMSATVLQPNVLSNLRAQASASASATASPQQVSVLRLVPQVQVTPDGRVVEVVDQVRLEQAEQLAAQQRAREALGLAPLQQVSASSSASLSSVGPVDRRVVLDSLEARLAARRNEQIRLVNEVAAAQQQVAQAQAQEQSVSSVNPLLSATRLAQSLASLTPTGATSSSRAQLLESPELARLRQQQLVQLQRLDLQRPVAVQANGVPLVVGPNGQLVAAPVVVL